MTKLYKSIGIILQGSEILDSKIKQATRTISFIEKSIDLLEKIKFEYEEIKHFSKKEQKIFAICEHTQYWEHDSNARMFAETYDVGIEELHTSKSSYVLMLLGGNRK